MTITSSLPFPPGLVGGTLFVHLIFTTIIFHAPKHRHNRRKRGRDEFDRFGGRETPRVLRGGSLIGGGEHTEDAILELRCQLAIAKVCSLISTLCHSTLWRTLLLEIVCCPVYYSRLASSRTGTCPTLRRVLESYCKNIIRNVLPCVVIAPPYANTVDLVETSFRAELRRNDTAFLGLGVSFLTEGLPKCMVEGRVV